METMTCSLMNTMREKKIFTVGNTLNLVNHVWRVAGIFESGKLARICAKLSVAQDLNGTPQTYAGFI